MIFGLSRAGGLENMGVNSSDLSEPKSEFRKVSCRAHRELFKKTHRPFARTDKNGIQRFYNIMYFESKML